jgi:hypothetical protein
MNQLPGTQGRSFDRVPASRHGFLATAPLVPASTAVERHDARTVMRAPESNEFCVEPGPVGR